jgi:hypothetical protein
MKPNLDRPPELERDGRRVSARLQPGSATALGALTVTAPPPPTRQPPWTRPVVLDEDSAAAGAAE